MLKRPEDGKIWAWSYLHSECLWNTTKNYENMIISIEEFNNSHNNYW